MICRRIVRISRVVSGLARAIAFYRDALGFSVTRRLPVGHAARAALGLPRATQAVLRRGGQEIALVRPLRRGRRIPPDSRSNDLWFQHLAIVVADMDAAFARLSAHTGWQPISQGGPQALPAANGGVQAFKFRDPDGHPLELIRFPQAAARDATISASTTPRSRSPARGAARCSTARWACACAPAR